MTIPRPDSPYRQAEWVRSSLEHAVQKFGLSKILRIDQLVGHPIEEFEIENIDIDRTEIERILRNHNQ